MQSLNYTGISIYIKITLGLSIQHSCFSFIINICMYAFQIAWFKNIVLQTKKKEINTNSKFD